MNDYSLFTHDATGTARTVKLSAMQRYAHAIGREDVAADLDRLARTGDRYSLEHFDVMNRAHTALGSPALWLHETIPALGQGHAWEDVRARCS